MTRLRYSGSVSKSGTQAEKGRHGELESSNLSWTQLQIWQKVTNKNSKIPWWGAKISKRTGRYWRTGLQKSSSEWTGEVTTMQAIGWSIMLITCFRRLIWQEWCWNCLTLSNHAIKIANYAHGRNQRWIGVLYPGPNSSLHLQVPSQNSHFT